MNDVPSITAPTPRAARPDPALVAGEHPFAQYVRTLGRGPGRSRALTREEAEAALGMVLRGEADPHQIGAFLMLLRYRGEDPAEMAGLVAAAREAMGAGLPAGCPPVALDWPSYGAGRTRGAPWFLLAALALARAGHRVLMHGSNEFTRGTSVTAGLEALGIPVCASPAQATDAIGDMGFAYLPLETLCPALDALLRLRGLLGLRSPINTAARLLNPFDAPAGVDGVFHPPYVALHIATASLLGRGRLVVVKGGGGEAERNPAKPMEAHWFDGSLGQGHISFAPLAQAQAQASEADDLVAVWRGAAGSTAPGPGAMVAQATVALGVLALGLASTPEGADQLAAIIWAARLG